MFQFYLQFDQLPNKSTSGHASRTLVVTHVFLILDVSNYMLIMTSTRVLFQIYLDMYTFQL